MQVRFNICKSINIIYHINQMKSMKSYDHINRCRKSISQNPTHIYDKTLSKVRIQGTYFNIIKAIYDKSTANIILNSEKLKAFSLRLGTIRMSTSTTFIQHSIGSSSHRKKDKKKKKASKLEKKQENCHYLQMT